MTFAILSPQIQSDEKFYSDFAQSASNCVQESLLDPLERLIASPILVTQESAEAVGNATARLVDLIYEIPARLFSSDVAAFARACGFSDEAIQCMMSAPGSSARFARSDAYLTSSGWKITEFNIGSTIGCYHLDWAYRKIENSQFVHDALSRNIASRIDTADHWVQMILADAHKSNPGCTRPHICIVDSQKHFERHLVWNRSMARALTATGQAEASACSARELTFRGSEMYFEGNRIDYIYRLFGLDDIVGEPDLYEPILQRIRLGSSGMGMSLDSRIYGNKASLAFLSDPKYSHIYSADELALINRYIPTTRLLSSESINFSQEQ